jgi:hypothetical protein
VPLGPAPDAVVMEDMVASQYYCLFDTVEGLQTNRTHVLSVSVLDRLP